MLNCWLHSLPVLGLMFISSNTIRHDPSKDAACNIPRAKVMFNKAFCTLFEGSMHGFWCNNNHTNNMLVTNEVLNWWWINPFHSSYQTRGLGSEI